MRVPWGEGSGGVGVGARGSCQGGGAPVAGRAIRESPLRRCGGGGQGNHEGCPYGEVMACGGRRVLLVAEGPSTGSGRTDSRSAPYDGVWRRGARATTRVAPTARAEVADGKLPLLRDWGSRTAPTTVWGVGDATGVGGGGGPFDRLRANGFARRACGGLEEGGQGNHEGCPYSEVMACAGRRGLMVAEGPSTGSGRTVCEVPLRRCGESAMRAGLVVALRQAQGERIPAGMTMGCAGRRALLVAEGPSTRLRANERICEGAPTTGCGGGFLLLRGCGRLGRLLGVGFLGGCLGSG